MMRSNWSRRTLLGALAGVLTTGLLGCGGGIGELERKQAAWRAARPDRYHFDHQTTGFAFGGGPWRVEVEGEQVVSVSWAGEGAAPSYTPGVDTMPTVEDLFEQVADSLLRNGVEVEVTYDSQWHHPVEAFFDWGEEGDGFKAGNLTSLD